jgi:hypothetical protein
MPTAWVYVVVAARTVLGRQGISEFVAAHVDGFLRTDFSKRPGRKELCDHLLNDLGIIPGKENDPISGAVRSSDPLFGRC